jgi:hypothetical protein
MARDYTPLNSIQETSVSTGSIMFTEWASSHVAAAKCHATQAGLNGESFFGQGSGGTAVVANAAHPDLACHPALSPRPSANPRRASRAGHSFVSRPPTVASTLS